MNGSQRYEPLKRCIDFVLSVVLIVALSPIFCVIYVSVILFSGNPAFFVQKRAGKDGAAFTIIKFRTMARETPPYMRKPGRNDPRITPVGRPLRATGLDELPQLFNVLEGTMSLVGPRPEMFFDVAYTGDRERLRVRPGITGSWQLSGRTEMPIHQNPGFDAEYLKSSSLLLDAVILGRTFVLLVKKTGEEVGKAICRKES